MSSYSDWGISLTWILLCFDTDARIMRFSTTEWYAGFCYSKDNFWEKDRKLDNLGIKKKGRVLFESKLVLLNPCINLPLIQTVLVICNFDCALALLCKPCVGEWYAGWGRIQYNSPILSSQFGRSTLCCHRFPLANVCSWPMFLLNTCIGVWI